MNTKTKQKMIKGHSGGGQTFDNEVSELLKDGWKVLPTSVRLEANEYGCYFIAFFEKTEE